MLLLLLFAALESVRRLVAVLTAPLRYHRRYPCTVQRQAADLTLDLLPDDPEIAGTGLQGVKIRHGLPGVTVKVKVGSRCLLGWEAGDPRRPYCSLWEPGAIDEISFDGGNKPIARQGDSVTCFWPPSVPVTGTLAGAAFVGTMTITSPAPGIIQSGAPKVKA